MKTNGLHSEQQAIDSSIATKQNYNSDLPIPRRDPSEWIYNGESRKDYEGSRPWAGITPHPSRAVSPVRCCCSYNISGGPQVREHCSEESHASPTGNYRDEKFFGGYRRRVGAFEGFCHEARSKSVGSSRRESMFWVAFDQSADASTVYSWYVAVWGAMQKPWRGAIWLGLLGYVKMLEKYSILSNQSRNADRVREKTSNRERDLTDSRATAGKRRVWHIVSSDRAEGEGKKKPERRRKVEGGQRAELNQGGGITCGMGGQWRGEDSMRMKMPKRDHVEIYNTGTWMKVLEVLRTF